MRISVPAETAVHERRVALVPDGVARLVKSGHHVTVQRGAGARAFLADQLYEEAGATLAADAAVSAGTLIRMRMGGWEHRGNRREALVRVR